MDNQYNIRRNDRVFFVGSTGSGKTSLAKSLLWNLPYVVILDPKRQFSLPAAWPMDVLLTSSLDEAVAVTDDKTIIYRPSYEENQDRCNAFFQWIFNRQNTTVFIDEVMPIVPSNRLGYWYARCIQEGRERGLAVWSATQRPAAIPLAIMTEAEHYFVFRLANPDDRKRMADYGGIELREPVKTGHTHGFRYFNVRTGKVKYWKKANIGKALS